MLGYSGRKINKLTESAQKLPQGNRAPASAAFSVVTQEQPQVALRYPLRGDVSYPLPMPKAWLFRRSPALAVNRAPRAENHSIPAGLSDGCSA